MDEEKFLYDYNSLEELAENFSLEELFTLAKNKNLEEWLESNFYDDESQKVADAVDGEVSDAELKLLICKIFNIDFSRLTADELQEISELISEKQNLKISFDKPSNGRKVTTQGELVRALKDGAKVIYLCGDEFKISHKFHGITYIGRNNAVIDFTDNADIDFDERDIIFEDVQIYVHHPVDLRLDKSKNVKVINGSKNTLDDYLTLEEIFEVMRGRNPFESAENFTKRAENIRGAAVGTVLLKDTDYIFDAQKFPIKPKWDFEYVSVMKDYSDGKNFAFKISPEDAEKLYNNERKLQIFADFTCIDGKLTIAALYFETLTLGRIFIEDILKILTEEKFSSGSGIYALGYGLELITAYEEWDGWS